MFVRPPVLHPPSSVAATLGAVSPCSVAVGPFAAGGASLELAGGGVGAAATSTRIGAELLGANAPVPR